MANAYVIVCDDCGKPAVKTLRFKVEGVPGTREKDVCTTHLAAAIKNSRKARRGRPASKGTAPAPKANGSVRRKPRRKAAAKK